MNMLQIYECILSASGYQVTDDGKVKRLFNEKLLPVAIPFDDEHRQLVMPTKENMNSPNVLDYVIFHPFQENLARGESKVLQYMRKELNRSYGASVSALILALVDISAGAINHTELTTKQRDIIAKMGKIDTKLAEAIHRIIKNLHKRNNRNTPVFLSLKKGHEHKGKKYSRAAIWSFPLADEVYSTIEACQRSKDNKPRILNVDVRKGDLDSLKKLCDLFFPDSQKENDWIGLSDATDAPYIESYVRSLGTLPKYLNSLSETFFGGKNHVYSNEVAKNNLEVTTLNIDWVTDDFEVSKWRSEYLKYPIQEGCEGIAPIDDRKINVNSRKEPRKWDDVTEEAKGNVSEDSPPWEGKKEAQPERSDYRRQDRREPVEEKTSASNMLDALLGHSRRERDDYRDRDYRDDYRRESRDPYYDRRPSSFDSLYSRDRYRELARPELPSYYGGRETRQSNRGYFGRRDVSDDMYYRRQDRGFFNR